LAPGKDADFVIWSGSPLSSLSIAEQTWVDGVKEFDRAADLIERDKTAQARADAIAKIKGDVKPGPREDDKATAKPVPAAVPAAYGDRLASSGPTVSIVHATVH